MKIAFTALLAILIAQTSFADERLADKLYMDFFGRRPTVNELQSYKARVEQTNGNPVEMRQYIKELLANDLMTSSVFRERLRNYFNGLFSVSEIHGEVFNPDRPEGTPDILGKDFVEVSQDFRDEAAMLVAAVISGMGDSSPDVRNILETQKTIVTPRMAKYVLEIPNLLGMIGWKAVGGNVNKLTSWAAMAADPDPRKSNKWYWFDRDPDDSGILTTAGHKERHAGVLTTVPFLMRSPSHLSRANNFYSWFLCRNVGQSQVPETQAIKLMDRQPCSGCHTILEPLGSFWVQWRPKITPRDVQPWVLDNSSSANTIPVDETIPTRTDYSKSAHSRTLNGSFHNKSGRGVRALADIVKVESDFPRCMAQHAWQFLLGRPMYEDENGWAKVLGLRLAETYNWDLREVFIDIVLSEAYLVRSDSDK